MSVLNVDTINSADLTYEYGKCLAWVNFNGTGTPAIRDSVNVSSITDTATGRFTINFTNNLPSTNYVVCGISGNAATTASDRSIVFDDALAVSGAAIRVINNISTAIDDAVVTLAFFGNL